MLLLSKIATTCSSSIHSFFLSFPLLFCFHRKTLIFGSIIGFRSSLSSLFFGAPAAFFCKGDDTAKSIETAKTISFPAFRTWKTKVACHFERTIVYSSSSCLNIMTFFCKSAFISPLPATPLTSETSLRSWASRLLHPPMCKVSRS